MAKSVLRVRIVAPVLAVGALAGVAVAARREGVSLRAWLIAKAVPLLAPRILDEAALKRAIVQTRARGPGAPSRRLRKRFAFRVEMRGEDRLFRLARKQQAGPLKMLYLHGGAYVFPVQTLQWAIAAGLLDRVGGEVVAPLYPLAPEHGFRDGLAAAERSYDDLVREAGASNVVIFGDSAGGGLALALAQRLRDTGRPLPSSIVLFSPWLDVSVSGDDQPALEARDPVLTIDFLRMAGRMWAGDVPTDDPRVSPLFGTHYGLPPTLVFSGTRDVLDSDALRLVIANPAVDHRHYTGMIHVWPCAPIPEAGRALDEAAAFIEQGFAASRLDAAKRQAPACAASK